MNVFAAWKRRLYAPIDQYAQQTPSVERFRKYHEGGDEHEGSPLLGATCVTINIIMGSGFLALPKAFVAAGLSLSVMTLIVVVILMLISSTWEVEIMCRAEAWMRANLLQDEGLVSALKKKGRKTLGNGLINGSSTGPGASQVFNYSAVEGRDIDAESGSTCSTSNGSSGHSSSNSNGSNSGSGSGSGCTGGTGGNSLLSPSGLLSPTGEGGISLYSPPRVQKRAFKVKTETLLPQAVDNAAAAAAHKQEVENSEMVLRQHAYQLTEMCEVFGGERFKLLYNILISIYLYFVLWGYGTVFATAMAAHARPDFLSIDNAYSLYILIFAAIVVPLCCKDIREQVGFQMGMCAVRVLVIVTMTATVVYAMVTGTKVFGESYGYRQGQVHLVHFPGWFEVIPSLIFAVMVNSSVPVVVQTLKDKNQSGQAIRWAMLVTMLNYGILSVVVAYYFADEVAPSCNVNWVSFDGGAQARGEERPLWATALSYFVVLFPALDVLSVYPLNSIVLANNAMAAVYHDRVDKAERDTVIRNTFSIAVGLPPLICACLFRSLTAIIGYTGSIAIIIGWVIPPLLNKYSQTKCMERFGHMMTPFTYVTSKPVVLMSFVVMGFSLLAYLIYEDVMEAIGILQM